MSMKTLLAVAILGAAALVALVLFMGTADVRAQTSTESGDSDNAAPKLEASIHHTCALHADGSLECVGWDSDGQVTDTPGGNGYIDVSLGLEHTCALDVDGAVECWGSDEQGQVSNAPTDNGYIALVSGGEFTCAWRADKTKTCWGRFTEDEDAVAVSGTPTAELRSQQGGGGFAAQQSEQPTATPISEPAAQQSPPLPTATPVSEPAAQQSPPLPTATPVSEPAAQQSPPLPTATPVSAPAAQQSPPPPTATPVSAPAAQQSPPPPTATPVSAPAAQQGAGGFASPSTAQQQSITIYLSMSNISVNEGEDKTIDVIASAPVPEDVYFDFALTGVTGSFSVADDLVTTSRGTIMTDPIPAGETRGKIYIITYDDNRIEQMATARGVLSISNNPNVSVDANRNSLTLSHQDDDGMIVRAIKRGSSYDLLFNRTRDFALTLHAVLSDDTADNRSIDMRTLPAKPSAQTDEYSLADISAYKGFVLELPASFTGFGVDPWYDVTDGIVIIDAGDPIPTSFPPIKVDNFGG